MLEWRRVVIARLEWRSTVRRRVSLFCFVFSPTDARREGLVAVGFLLEESNMEDTASARKRGGGGERESRLLRKLPRSRDTRRKRSVRRVAPSNPGKTTLASDLRLQCCE